MACFAESDGGFLYGCLAELETRVLSDFAMGLHEERVEVQFA